MTKKLRKFWEIIVILSWTTLRGQIINKMGLSHSKTCEDNVIEVYHVNCMMDFLMTMLN
jgi:hypothetical protein